jgi:catechol 2,3-dioxygenase-like lactoylglutathione lyase family enzyme
MSGANAGNAVSRQVQVTFDCEDPRALSLFWNEVLGYRFPPPPPGFDSWDAFSESLPPERRNSASACEDPEGSGPRLFFQRVPEGKAAKNRVHLDVRAAPGLQGEERMAALESECERLVGLGATRVQRFDPEPPMQAGHIVVQDPEGNEFCLD